MNKRYAVMGVAISLLSGLSCSRELHSSVAAQDRLTVSFQLTESELSRASERSRSQGLSVSQLAKKHLLASIVQPQSLPMVEVPQREEGLIIEGLWQKENLAIVDSLGDGTQVRIHARWTHFFSPPSWNNERYRITDIYGQPYVIQSSLDGHMWKGISGGFLETRSGPVKVKAKPGDESLVKIRWANQSGYCDLSIPNGAQGETEISFSIGDAVLQVPFSVIPIPISKPPGMSDVPASTVIQDLGFPSQKIEQEIPNELWVFQNLSNHATLFFRYNIRDDDFGLFNGASQAPSQFWDLWDS